MKLFNVLMLMSLSMSVYAEGPHCDVIGMRVPNTQIYNGPTRCYKEVLPELTVHGPLTMVDSRVQGDAHISGPLHADNSQFKSIEVKQRLTAPKVALRHHTVVSGDIIFTEHPGHVYLDKSSQILGEVRHGQVMEDVR